MVKCQIKTIFDMPYPINMLQFAYVHCSFVRKLAGGILGNLPCSSGDFRSVVVLPVLGCVSPANS